MPEEAGHTESYHPSLSKPETKGLLQRLKDSIPYIPWVMGGGVIFFFFCVGLYGFYSAIAGDPFLEQPAKQTALDYFVTIKSNYPGAAFGEPKTANFVFLTVSDADRANGITYQTTLTLTFIYRETPTGDWKDAQWKLWLEKKTDWKVVNAQKER